MPLALPHLAVASTSLAFRFILLPSTFCARRCAAKRSGKSFGARSLRRTGTWFSSVEFDKDVSLEVLKRSIPTISKVLPLFKLMEINLTYVNDGGNLSNALLAGAWMATKYINKALAGDYPLLRAGTRIVSIKLSFSITAFCGTLI